VGVEGHSTNSPIGTGVVGFGNATGGYFEAIGNSDTRGGVYGVGFETGVTGRSKLAADPDRAAGTGVYGENNLSGGIGVRGQASSGTGVQGFSTSGTGVYGYSASGWAGLFQGKVHVNGTLSKNAGSFKIDHPLDPANKYLSHSFVESPDMMNIYSGNVTTDKNGDALINLPAYFEALNRDFRYQLTVMGQFAQAIVASEIKDNRFTIKTDKPNVKVSWHVAGIRQDPYAKAYPIRVEEDKPIAELGHYLHPELYGQSEGKSINQRITEVLR
jgi:hypothetical protein